MMPPFAKLTLGAAATAALLTLQTAPPAMAEDGKGLFGFKSSQQSAAELSKSRSQKANQDGQSTSTVKKAKKKKKKKRTRTRRGSFDY